MSPALPQVRLNKDRSRAICTRVECGEPFADVFTGVPDEMTIHLEFLGGWKPSGDGVMRMDGRARRNVSQGRGPRLRRAPNADTGLSFTTSGQVIIPKPRERTYTPASHLNRVFVPLDELPIEAVCPACGMRQVLNEDLFTVS